MDQLPNPDQTSASPMGISKFHSHSHGANSHGLGQPPLAHPWESHGTCRGLQKTPDLLESQNRRTWQTILENNMCGGNSQWPFSERTGVCYTIYWWSLSNSKLHLCFRHYDGVSLAFRHINIPWYECIQQPGFLQQCHAEGSWKTVQEGNLGQECAQQQYLIAFLSLHIISQQPKDVISSKIGYNEHQGFIFVSSTLTRISLHCDSV